MQPLWSHKTSVTRDFVVLSLVIVFIAILASVWVAFETFQDQSRKIQVELEAEAKRIDNAFHDEISRAAYLLEAVGRQIIQRGTSDATMIAQMLRTFDSSDYYYNVFLWVDEDLNGVTSSRQGVLENPVDLSDRGYIKKSVAEPFKVQIGKPIQGRVSEQLVIPLAMGLTDYTGKYIGSVTLSVELDAMRRSVQNYVRNENIAFAILNDSFSILSQNDRSQMMLETGDFAEILETKKLERGNKSMLTVPELFSANRTFSHFQYSNYHEYIILTGLESSWTTLRQLMLPRLLQLGFVSAFLVSLLWLVRFRVIFPVQSLAESCSEISRGNLSVELSKNGPLEISNLAQQLQNIVDYIAERKRIEDELIAKVLALKTAKDIAEVSDQAKMEILSALRQELGPAMEKMLNASSILHDQPYGKIEGDEYRTYIEELDISSTHLAEVMHHILEFPRIDRRESPLTRKPSDVRGIVHKSLTLLHDVLEAEEVSVNVKIPDGLPKLPIHELHLMHVVMHLLLVCARSIPAGGELTVDATLEETDAHTEFAIFFKDNGTGLDTQHIAKLWRSNESGQRLQSHATAEDEASYSAITLTKKFITLHNGRMTMQNPPGKEAIVALYFQQ